MTSIRLFLSEYTVLFLILMIVYFKYFFILRSTVPLLLVPYAVLSALLVLSNYGYYRLLTTEEDKESPRDYHVTEVGESATYTNMIATYVLGLLPLLQATLIDLIVFVVVLFFIFELSKESEALFFNPLLFLIGYRVYRVRVEEHNKSIYVICKEKIQEGDYIKVVNLYEKIYLDRRIIKGRPRLSP